MKNLVRFKQSKGHWGEGKCQQQRPDRQVVQEFMAIKMFIACAFTLHTRGARGPLQFVAVAARTMRLSLSLPLARLFLSLPLKVLLLFLFDLGNIWQVVRGELPPLCCHFE